MSGKHTPRLAKAAVPYLRPGEKVEIGAFATVGSVSVKRQFVTAAVVGVATLGHVAATVRPARRYLAVTGQRLLFFNGEVTFGTPGKILFILPKEAVAVVKAGRHLLFHRIELAVAGQEKGLLINFPITARATMEQVAASLPAAGNAGASRPPAHRRLAYEFHVRAEVTVKLTDADLQGADGRGRELAVHVDRREPCVAGVTDIAGEPGRPGNSALRLPCIALAGRCGGDRAGRRGSSERGRPRPPADVARRP